MKLFKRKKKISASIYIHLTKVICSCENLEQLQNVKAWVDGVIERHIVSDNIQKRIDSKFLLTYSRMVCFEK